MKKKDKGAWAFFWASCGVAATLGLFAAPPLHWSIITLSLASAVTYSVAALLFDWFKAPTPVGTVVRTVALLILIWGGMAVLTYLAWPEPIAPAEPNVAIFMKCDIRPLPITVPANGSIQILAVNERYLRVTKQGSAEITNPTSEPVQWPSKEVMAEAKQKHDLGVFILACDVSNHGQVNVLDVAIPAKFWFGSAVGEANVVFVPIISPLDAGQHRTLYLVNDCPVEATVIFQGVASLHIVGESKTRTVKLNLPQRNMMDQLMMFFPTDIRWLNMTECKSGKP